MFRAKPATFSYYLLIHGLALLALSPTFWSWPAFTICLVLYLLTGLGITLGYHRLLAHSSYNATPWMMKTLTLLGALAGQGGPIFWVSLHRRHHCFSDQELDPHNSRLGFLWSHVWWTLDVDNDLSVQDRIIRDLQSDPFLSYVEKWFLAFLVSSALVIYFTGFLIGGYDLAVSFLVWGVGLRMACVLHFTWITNSVCHKFGSRRYDTNDSSTNCWWASLLTLGEGWHNNHHAFPSSARHGFTWYEIDISWYVLLLLSKIGWVSGLRCKPKLLEDSV